MESPNPEAVVSIRHLSKVFGGGRPALDDVALDVMPGTIHALLGQNGSGKSTLIKILAGYHRPEHGGELQILGRDVPLPLAPGQFRELGMSFVHQNLGLVESITVLDNFRIGRYESGLAWRIPWRRERQVVRDALARFGLRVDPDESISALPQSTRAVIAIARAVQDLEHATNGPGLLILDEPTPYLSRDAVALLFDAVREAAAAGAGVLFVSHRLEEVHELTDRITVLRDGRVVGEVETSEISSDDLIELIIGRRLEDLYPAPPQPGDARVLSVRDLSGDLVDGVSFDLNAHEILGLTGLVGMGFEEVPYLLMGTQQGSGEFELDGAAHPVAGPSVRSRIDLGLALVPSNRERQGAALALTVAENLTIPRISDFFRHALIDSKRERAEVLRLIEEFDIRPPDPDRAAGTLSGGNQQKAVLGKWLSTQPKVLILHEPTQGVDIGARKQIFGHIRASTDRGTSVLLASLEYEDLAHLCDRVLVFRDGQVVSELAGAMLTKERIVEQCYRPSAQAAAGGRG